jgi:prepilin peptidase CpaA
VSLIWNCGTGPAFLGVLYLAVFLGLIAHAVYSDIRGFRIPNLTSLALITLFLFYWVIQPSSVILRDHLYVAAAAFSILFLLYLFGWFGAGDVKLIAAIMLWAGPIAGVQFVIALSVAGLVFALFLIAVRQALSANAVLSDYLPSRLIRWAQRGVCPYGVPILAAALYVSPLLFSRMACAAA